MSEKRRLILIHGFTERPTMWDKLKAAMSDSSITISTPSIPGHGEHPQLPEVHTTETYCEAILKQIPRDELPWIVVGHSMGGYLASSLVLHSPNPISALGLFHSKTGADHNAKREDRKRAIDAAEQNKNLYLSTMLRNTFASGSIEQYTEAMHHMIAEAQQDITYACIAAAQQVMIERPDCTEAIAQQSFSVHYFLGGEDKSIPPDSLNDEINSIRRAKTTLVQHAGHMGHIECYDRAEAWLKSICSKS